MGLGVERPLVPIATCKTMIYRHKTNTGFMRVGITKKVRMDQREADRLARLAHQLNLPESDVLREGLALIEKLQSGALTPEGVRNLGLRRMLDDLDHQFEH